MFNQVGEIERTKSKADKVEICELLQGKRRKRIESLIREFHLSEEIVPETPI